MSTTTQNNDNFKSYTLQSNASLDIHPNNKPNNFRVRLMTPFDLPGKWMVGLSEIHFPCEFTASNSSSSSSAATAGSRMLAEHEGDVDAHLKQQNQPEVAELRRIDHTVPPTADERVEFRLKRRREMKSSSSAPANDKRAKRDIDTSNSSDSSISTIPVAALRMRILGDDESLLNADQLDKLYRYAEWLLGHRGLISPYNVTELREQIKQNPTNIQNIVETIALRDRERRARDTSDPGAYPMDDLITYTLAQTTYLNVNIRRKELRKHLINWHMNVDQIIEYIKQEAQLTSISLNEDSGYRPPAWSDPRHPRNFEAVDEMVDFVVEELLDKRNVVHIDNAQVREAVYPATYLTVFPMMDEMVAKDRVRRKTRNLNDGAYTLEQLIRYAVRTFDRIGVPYNLNEVKSLLGETEMQQFRTVDEVIDEILNTERSKLGMVPYTISHIDLKYDLLPSTGQKNDNSKAVSNRLRKIRSIIRVTKPQERSAPEHIVPQEVTDILHSVYASRGVISVADNNGSSGSSSSVVASEIPRIDTSIFSTPEATVGEPPDTPPQTLPAEEDKDRDIDSEFTYAFDKIYKRWGKQRTEIMSIVELIESGLDIKAVIHASYIGPPHTPRPPPSFIDEFYGITDADSALYKNLPVETKLVNAALKAALLHDEIQERNLFNSSLLYGTQHSVDTSEPFPTRKLVHELDSVLKRMVRNFKKLDISHIDEDGLKRIIASGISGHTIVETVRREHLKRASFDQYTKQPFQCKSGIPTHLYINCDVAENEPVGDVIAPLLRVVRVPTDGRKTHDKDWTVPSFKPVAKHFIHQMEMDIRDERGCPVSFANGVVIATLQFKRVG
jgi:hypothetical protein